MAVKLKCKSASRSCSANRNADNSIPNFLDPESYLSTTSSYLFHCGNGTDLTIKDSPKPCFDPVHHRLVSFFPSFRLILAVHLNPYSFIDHGRFRVND